MDFQQFCYVFDTDIDHTVSITAKNQKEAILLLIRHISDKIGYLGLFEPTIVRIAKYPNGEVVYDKEIDCND